MQFANSDFGSKSRPFLVCSLHLPPSCPLWPLQFFLHSAAGAALWPLNLLPACQQAHMHLVFISIPRTLSGSSWLIGQMHVGLICTMGITMPPYRVETTVFYGTGVTQSQSPANNKNLRAPLTTSRKRNITVVKQHPCASPEGRG